VKGRDIFFAYLEHNGVPFLFGNPGTTELPLVDGCNDHPAVRYVMALHEDIAVAMAMGYARASGRVGVVNLHVAPGLGHGMGNLYNAFRAGTPLIVTAGQQHTRLVVHDPILTADLAAMARPFTKWSYDVRFVEELPTVMQRAFKEATTAPTGPVFISLPMDVLLETVNFDPPVAASTIASTIADPKAVAHAARVLADATHPMIVAGDGVGLSCAWPEVVAIAERLGAPVYTEQYSTIWNFPSDHPHFAGPMPNQAVAMRQRFEGVDVALLAGFTAQAPVARFDEKGSLIPPSVQIVVISRSDPRLPLPRRRVQGRLVEIRSPDLASSVPRVTPVSRNSCWCREVSRHQHEFHRLGGETVPTPQARWTSIVCSRPGPTPTPQIRVPDISSSACT